MNLSFPKQDVGFDVLILGACPRSVDQIAVYPNLGSDKIFNP
jgi:hypothetical protein